MNRRRALMANQGGIPKGYQPIEWIKSDGSAYLDLNYIPQDGDSYEIAFYNTRTVGDKILFGSTSTYAEYYGGNRFYGACPPSKYSNVLQSFLYLNKKVKLTLDTNTVFITDGQNSSSDYANNTATSDTGNLLLFNWNRSPSYINDVMQIYYFNSKSTTDDIRIMIPCYRKSDGVIGMYDMCGSICTLTNTPFYINAGTGSFLKGEDI